MCSSPLPHGLPQPRLRRAGFGAPFIVVMAVMVLLSLYAVSMSVRSQGASQQTRKALFLETSDELVQLALSEALFVLRRHANDPGHPVFTPLRAAGGGDLPALPLSALPYSADEFGRRPGYSLDQVRIEVVRWQKVAGVTEEAVSYEAEGVLRLSATVRGPEASRAFHELEIDFRTALAAVTQPFDRMTFFLGDTEALLREGALGGDPNATIDFAATTMAELKSKLEQLLAGIPAVLTELQQKLSEAEANPLASSSDKNKLRAGIQAFTQLELEVRQALTPPRWPASPDWTVKDAGAPTEDEPNTVHRFLLPLSVCSYEPAVTLDTLHLPSEVGPRLEAWRDRTGKREAAGRAVQASQAAAQDDPMALLPPMKQFLSVVEQDLDDLHNVMTAYKTFQDRLIEISNQDREDLALRARRMYAAEFRRKADFLFVGEGQAAQAGEFLRARPAPVGVVYVDDPSSPLTVDVRDLVGRLVVFAGQQMVVDGATVRDRDRDALVLIANREMRVRTQEITAALVTLSGDYFGPETSFHGSLLLGGLPDQRALDTALKGTVNRLEPLVTAPSGQPPSPEVIQVVLGPTPLYRRSAR